MKKIISSTLLALGTVMCGISYAHADTTAPTVSYTFNNQILTVTPTGSTTIDVSAGEDFTITGSWSSDYDGSGTDVVQTYLAGLSPFSGQVDLFSGVADSGSGTYSATFAAPTTAGTYYIGGGFTLDYQFDPGVIGQANSSGQVSYIIDVGAAPTPEPSSLILLGSGLLGIVVMGRKWRPV